MTCDLASGVGYEDYQKQRHCNKFRLCYRVFKKHHMPRAEKCALLIVPGVILYTNLVRLVGLALWYICLGMGIPASQTESSLSCWRYYGKSWSLMGGGWGSSTGSAKVLKMKPSQKMQNLWINSVEKNWRSGQNQFEINPWKAYSYITNYPPMLTFPPMSLTWPWWPSNRIQYPIINFSMQKMLLLD